MNDDDTKKFLQQIYNLRQLQKDYFKNKNSGLLIRCKEAEREIDAFLVPFINSGTIISRERRSGERSNQLTAL
jgi:hypothetical protein